MEPTSNPSFVHRYSQMTDQEDNWSPDIQEYFRYFDLQPTESSDPLRETNFPCAWSDDNIIPLSGLEDSLSQSDL